MGRKKTHEEFVKEINDLVGNEYVVLSKYINKNTKIKMKHNICGHEWHVYPSNFLKGSRCPKCKGIKNGNRCRKTHDEFIKEVYNLVKDEYTIIGTYINNNTKVEIKHNTCGHVYEVKPSNFLNGKRCPKCAIKKRAEKRKLSNEDFLNKIPLDFKTEYKILDTYKKMHDKIRVKHLICGFEWLIEPNAIIRGNRCPMCANKRISEKKRKSTSEYKREVFEITNGEFLVLGEYINSNTKIKMKHVKCGYEYFMRPNDFLSGQRCPKCKQSKGEKRISEWLDKYNIKYNMQEKFNNCKDKSLLPFDFSVFDRSNNLICLLEFDGEFHFEAGRYSKNKKRMMEKLYLTQKHDKIKNQYCIDNNIPLIRIPYWEYDNIEYILKNVLMHYDLIEKDDTYDESIVKKYLVDENWDHDKYIEMSKNINKL